MRSEDSCWFAGPKAENADWFTQTLGEIAWDYYFWRRNYFPSDGAALNSQDRRLSEPFQDMFHDKLTELLGHLKGDCPFHSPRYAGHMVAEQTLPSIAGYFAAMLYNPNNISSEAAPVTLRLEMEAARMIARMLGHPDTGWAHLCSGGTLANMEALWVARSALTLPTLVAEVRHRLNLPPVAPPSLPSAALEQFSQLFSEGLDEEAVRSAVEASPANVSMRGLQALQSSGGDPVVLLPETHHYCFDKAADLLGLGKQCIRRVRVDKDFRMDVADLATQLDNADGRGEQVLAVVAVMGTTEEGAVDPLDKIVAVRDDRVRRGSSGFWIHSDAAYGGYLRCMMIPERVGLGEATAEAIVDGRPTMIRLDLPETSACDALAVLGHSDSITVDPHKLGYVPYPAGAVSFLDARVKPLVRQVAPYIADPGEGFASELASEQVGMYSLEGSKPGAVAASVWLSHQCIPLDTSGHGAVIRDGIRNASKLHSLLGEASGEATLAVTLCPPGSNIVCYAVRPKAETSLQEVNRLNRALYHKLGIGGQGETNIHARGFIVSRTTLAPSQYGWETVSSFLGRLGATEEEYRREGVFLLRSVLMNPWYGAYLCRGRDLLVELVQYILAIADSEILPTDG